MKPSRVKKKHFELDLAKLPALRGGKKGGVLACGGELKANYCLLNNKRAVLKYGFEDLKQPIFFDNYRRSLMRDVRKSVRDIRFIACDLNPVFLSSRLGRELQTGLLRDAEVIPVQHHFAHIAASCVASGIFNKLVLGVACDGTGWGDDEKVWGCEFIVSDLKSFERAGHLDYFGLPGSDKSVSEPWRTAFSLLYKALGEKAFHVPIGWVKKKRSSLKLLAQMIDKKVNTPFASSAGRLFDGISALLELCIDVKYEAQAPLMLEAEAGKAADRVKTFYKYRIYKKKDNFLIGTDILIRQIVKDIVKKEKREVIAARFHNTFADMLVSLGSRIARSRRIKDVVLGGGVFFNKIIMKKLVRGFKEKGLKLHVPPPEILGDTGLSLGQAVIALLESRSKDKGKRIKMNGEG